MCVDKGLNTNPNAGLTDAQAIKNQELYGKNEQEKRRLKTFCEMFLGALDDEMLKILMVAAVISIVV